MITQTSTYARAIVLMVTVALSGLTYPAVSFAQDIGGGASVLIASADVEAKLGKGIFSTPENRAHAPKHIEKKTIARSTVRSAHTRQTADSGKQGTASDKQGTDSAKQGTDTGKQGGDTGKETGRTNDTGPGSKLLGDAAKGVLTAEEYNKSGDNYFDAGQYEKAVDEYKQALRQKTNYPDAQLNLGEAYFNLERYEEAIAAEKHGTRSVLSITIRAWRRTTPGNMMTQ